MAYLTYLLYKNIIIYSDLNLLNGGRRIVDMKHVFTQIQNPNNYIRGVDCTFMDIEFVNEICMGFETRWYFKYKMCNKKTVLTSESRDLSYIPINKAAVNGTIAIGLGCTQIAELSASLDISCMSPTTFMSYNSV